MAFEQRELSGSLFRNDYKKSANQPDYRGSCKMGGIEYEMSAWIKQTGKGDDFFSIAYQVKEERPTTNAAPAKIKAPTMATGRPSPPERGNYPEPSDLGDDIPF
jgi:hypothetical protein